MSRPLQERGVDSVLYRLSGDPGQTPGEKIFHHGARIGLLVVLSVLVTILFPPPSSQEEGPL